MINDEIRKSKRGSRAMSKEELENYLDKVSYGTISYMSQEGWIDVRPMNFGYYNGNFYFHTAKNRGEKLKNFYTGKQVTLNFYRVSDRIGKDFIVKQESVIVYGHLERMDDQQEANMEEMKAGLKKMCDSADLAYKALGNNLDKCIPAIGIYKVKPDYIAGKMVHFSSTPEEHKVTME